ncbi:MAG TPA: MFS transporter [Ktedonobacteraceae bacterium]
MSDVSQTSLSRQTQKQEQSPNHPRISPFGWVMIALLFVLGAINFADKAVLGLAAIPIIKELHLSPSQYGVVSGSLFWLFAISSVLVTARADVTGTKNLLALLATTWAIVQFSTVFVSSFIALLLTRVALGVGEGPSYGTSVTAASKWLPSERRAFGLGVMTLGSSIGPVVFAPLLTFMIVEVGWRAAFAFLGGIGALWVVIWLVVARERPVDVSTPVHESHVSRHRTNWTQLLPIIFSRNIIFTILAAFAVYWGTALSLSWTPVYLVTALHLKLTSPLYIAGISLPWIMQGLAILACGALADRAFRRTGSARSSRVFLAGSLLILCAVFLYLAINIPSTLGAVTFFILAASAGAAIPLLAAIVLDVTPEEERGSLQGVVVGIATLPGFLAPLMTGVMIQAAGSNAIQGLHNAYVLAALLLLAFGVVFTIFVRPDGAISSLKTPGTAPERA